MFVALPQNICWDAYNKKPAQGCVNFAQDVLEDSNIEGPNEKGKDRYFSTNFLSALCL